MRLRGLTLAGAKAVVLLVTLSLNLGFAQDIDDLFGDSPATDTPAADTPVLDKPATSKSESSSESDTDREGLGKRIEIMDDYQEGLKMGRLEQRPVVVVLGAIWCTWCRKLESELDSDDGALILQKWVVVKVDVDQDPEVAELLEASALPGIRVIGLDEKVIASREGYSPVKQLQEWLDSKLNEANPKIQRVLYEQGEPTEQDITELIQFLAHRSPNIRAAASDRLIRNRSLVAEDMIQTLKTGRLIQKLAALQVLSAWRAPVQSIDPWTPDSINDASLQSTLDWLKDQEKETAQATESDLGSAGKLDDQAFSQELLKKLLNSKSDALMAQAITLGDSMLPEVRERLSHASDFDDQQQMVLRELLYRLLASEQSRLQQSSLLVALASLNGETHRAAAEKLIESSTQQDQMLIDELSSDPNPIIRELTIPKQQEFGALEDPDRLTRLLADKSPSVRTAILRELSENKNAKSIQILVDYIQKETDEDLLVYATKTLGTIGRKQAAQQALIQLTRNTSWRVRAAAIDAIGGTIGSSSLYSMGNNEKVSKEAAEAVIAGLQDVDPFVVSRAEALLVKLISQDTATLVAKYWMDHMEKVGPMLKEVSDYEKPTLLVPVVEAAKQLLKSEDPDQIRKAAALITKVSPTSLNDSIPELLESENSGTRLAALEALVATLLAPRLTYTAEPESGFSFGGSPSANKVGPESYWYPVPESLQTVPKAKNKRGEAALALVEESPPRSVIGSILGGIFGTSSSSDSNQESAMTQEEAAKVAEELASVDDFFGTAPTTSKDDSDWNPELQATVDSDAKLDPDQAGLPSKWLDNWYSDQPRARQHEWITPIQLSLQFKLKNESGEGARSMEQEWQMAASLAAGDSSLSSVLADRLVAEAAQTDKNSQLPTVEMIVPWLNSEDRVRVAKSTKVDWAEPSKKEIEFLTALTVVDDIEIANWILENIQTSKLAANQTARLRPFLLRALVGPAGDMVNPWVFAAQQGMTYESTFHIPGQKRSRDWLREKFMASQDDSVRALLLSMLSYVHYEVAVKSAVGLVAQASEPSQCLNVALVLALSDDSDISADRALQWLSHPVSEVQEIAIKYLCKAPQDFSETTQTDYSPVTVYQHENHLPGIWFVQREIPVEAVQSYVDTKAEMSSLARALLLATKMPPSIEEATKELKGKSASLLVCAVLSIAERTDSEALAYYEKFSESLVVGDDFASPLYAILRDLKGPEIRNLRTKLRLKQGSSIHSSY